MQADLRYLRKMLIFVALYIATSGRFRALVADLEKVNLHFKPNIRTGALWVVLIVDVRMTRGPPHCTKSMRVVVSKREKIALNGHRRFHP